MNQRNVKRLMLLINLSVQMAQVYQFFNQWLAIWRSLDTYADQFSELKDVRLVYQEETGQYLIADDEDEEGDGVR